MSKLDKMLLQGAKDGSIDQVRKAVELGANVNARDEQGRTALILTVNTEDAYDIIRYLLENGADIHAKDKDGKHVRDHLIMPPAPPEEHENAYEAWIHCQEHYLNTFLYNAMEE
jgi:ankyrin repeat protein